MPATWSEIVLVGSAALLAAAVLVQLSPPRTRPRWLGALSLLAYACWAPEHAPLLVLSCVGGWAVGHLIARTAGIVRGAVLGAGICGVIGLIVAYRLGWRGAGVYPLGLSYVSFRLLSYWIEIFWEYLPPRRDLASFVAYLAFAPQVVSGPIQRPEDFFEELDRPRAPQAALVLEGLVLAAWGCCKKAVADQLAVPVGAVFDAPASFAGAPLLVASHLFVLQLYLDFSGITDIALGVGRLFGIAGPENFGGPLLATNLQEFWKRWHISLTSWLRDYVFTPLAMVLRDAGDAGVVIAIVVNMLLMGLWHGFAWTFVAFGAVHAIAMVAFVSTPRLRKRLARIPGWRLVSWIATLELVVAAFTFFRARTIADATWIAARGLTAPATAFPAVPMSALYAGLFALVVSHARETGRLRLPRSEIVTYGLVSLAFTALYVLVDPGKPVSFIYQMF